VPIRRATCALSSGCASAPWRAHCAARACASSSAAGGVGALDPAAPHVRHVHRVPLDQVEHRIGGGAGEAHQAFTALAAEHRDQRIGIVLEARNDLPPVAP